MDSSILKSVKKNLGIDDAYTVFDPDITTFINTAFSTLNELGVGDANGFSIVDENDEWDSFIEFGPMQNSVKTYIYLRVRLLFDPPATSYTIKAFEDQLAQLEWRMNVRREGIEWAEPTPAIPDLEEV